MQCVTRRGSSWICCSVRVVVSIIMQPVWRLVPRPSSGQDGSAQSVKCVRRAGESTLGIAYCTSLIQIHCLKFAYFFNLCEVSFISLF